MRVAIAGAGNVGRSIATELVANGHEVLLIDSDARMQTAHDVRGAHWYIGDACELQNLEDANLDSYDVSIAATGDDKVNLVHSLLAKTEFGVPRTVGRVNNPHNEWMFDAAWGVDVAVSTPRIMTAMVEEAVTVGDVVKVFTFHQSGASMVEVTLPATAPVVGHAVREIDWPAEIVLSCIVRGDQVFAPSPADTLEAHDELLFIVAAEGDPEALDQVLRSAPTPTPPTE